VVWLLGHGPARQVEIIERLERRRGRAVNPGTVAALVKPLLDVGILVRDRPRGPIAIRDRQQLAKLLQASMALTGGNGELDRAETERDSDELRRALVQVLPKAHEGT
jgi:hypothetical protein